METKYITMFVMSALAMGLAPTTANALTADDLVCDRCVDTLDIAAHSIRKHHIYRNSIDSVRVIDESLTADDLAPDSVGESEIADGAVGTSEVLDNSLTNADLVDEAGLDFANISLTNIDVSAPVDLAKVTMAIPADGYVMVRVDGLACPNRGDQLFLGASDTSATLGVKDGSTYVYKGNSALPDCYTFSHSRVYPVTAGLKDFFAVAHNKVCTSGRGMASIYATLTAQYFPTRY